MQAIIVSTSPSPLARAAQLRPIQPKGQGRGDVLRLRLTDAERTILDAKAKAHNLNTATWARLVLLNA